MICFEFFINDNIAILALTEIRLLVFQYFDYPTDTTKIPNFLVAVGQIVPTSCEVFLMVQSAICRKFGIQSSFVRSLWLYVSFALWKLGRRTPTVHCSFAKNSKGNVNSLSKLSWKKVVEDIFSARLILQARAKSLAQNNLTQCGLHSAYTMAKALDRLLGQI